MKKKLVSALALMMSCVMLAACGGNKVEENTATPQTETSEAVTESTEEAASTETEAAGELTDVNVAALKGPTAMGMVKLMEEGYGVKQGIPQLILAGASVDDVYVIVLFSTFTGMMQGQSTSILSFINIPVSIFLGIGIGLLIGTCLAYYFKKVHIRDTSKVLIILSISLLLVVMEDSLNTAITFSALIAIMFIGIGLQKKREVVAKRISVKYGKLWVAAEVFLFVLVGATVNVGYLGKIGVKALVVIVGALVFRMLGVSVCLLGTSLKKTERLFAMMAYTPKATVQAAIGGIPLAMGFACGDTVLTVAVLAIVLTAPLGAFAIDFSYKKLLKKSTEIVMMKLLSVRKLMDNSLSDSWRTI